MQRVKLDQIDHRILRDLQVNGRMTNVELSKRAGISAPPCLRRVRALEEAGYITGYHAEIDGTMLDYKEMFFALVGLDSQAQNVLQDFETGMAAWAEVRECHMIRGGGDFLLKVVTKDIPAYEELILHQLSALTNVQTMKTSVVLSTFKNETKLTV